MRGSDLKAIELDRVGPKRGQTGQGSYLLQEQLQQHPLTCERKPGMDAFRLFSPGRRRVAGVACVSVFPWEEGAKEIRKSKDVVLRVFHIIAFPSLASNEWLPKKKVRGALYLVRR